MKLTKLEIETKLREIICEQLGKNPDQVQNESKFWPDLEADSLDQVELIMAAEEEFAIDISDDDAEKIITFGRAVDYIASRL